MLLALLGLNHSVAQQHVAPWQEPNGCEDCHANQYFQRFHQAQTGEQYPSPSSERINKGWDLIILGVSGGSSTLVLTFLNAQRDCYLLALLHSVNATAHRRKNEVTHDVDVQYSLAILHQTLKQDSALEMVCAANLDFVSIAVIWLLITSPKIQQM